MLSQEVWLFGNPDLPLDSLPIRLAPRLAKELPQFSFKIQDPLDEWPTQERLIIIDTVMGLKEIKVFTALDDFGKTPLVTMHDFDLKTELEFRHKLGELPPFIIIGLPPALAENEALSQLKTILYQYSK